jgi:hypothetical protein
MTIACRIRRSTALRAARAEEMLSRKTGPLDSPVTRGRANRSAARMGELIGYARCSTVLKDLTVRRQAVAALGVPGRRFPDGAGSWAPPRSCVPVR